MSQPVVWTSQCKAISLSVPLPAHPNPPPSFSFPPYPNKSCLSGKTVRPLVREANTELTPDSPVVSAAIYKRHSTSAWLSDMSECLVNNRFRAECASNFPQAELKLYCTCWTKIKGQHPSRASSFDLASGLSSFPRWVPTVWAEDLLGRFQIRGIHLESLFSPPSPFKEVML